MVAPLIAAAAPQAANSAIAPIKKALTGDIAVIHYECRQKKNKGKLNIEAHVNPLTIGLGATVIAVGGLVAWNGISVPGAQLFPGIKDTELGKRYSSTSTNQADTALQVVSPGYRFIKMLGL